MSMDTDELKEISISMVTSAVNARSRETLDERIEVYGSDFSMLLSDVTGEDLLRITSLLADMGGFLVEVLATTLDTSPEAAMQYIAQGMLFAEDEEES